MEQYIKEILSQREPVVIEQKTLIPSAVLLLVVLKGEGNGILLTKRSRSVAHHKGEISFPGGIKEPFDKSLLHTALREGKEEIGLTPQDVPILGRLDDVSTTTSGFVIATFVGVIPHPYTFRINHNEIASMLIVPLKTLCQQFKEKQVAEKKIAHRGNMAPSFYHQGEVIWGATAKILCQFLTLFCDDITAS